MTPTPAVSEEKETGTIWEHPGGVSYHHCLLRETVLGLGSSPSSTADILSRDQKGWIHLVAFGAVCCRHGSLRLCH